SAEHPRHDPTTVRDFWVRLPMVRVGETPRSPAYRPGNGRARSPLGRLLAMSASRTARKHNWPILMAVLTFTPAGMRSARADAAPLPLGVKTVWSFEKAAREVTPTRERISVNGLWRWQPAQPGGAQPPPDGWGHFKVPGPWPGITDYMQHDAQTLFP